MSKHNTMTSNMSDVLSQQQQNLQHLQALEQGTKSLTSNDQQTFYQPVGSVAFDNHTLPQQTPYPVDNVSTTEGPGGTLNSVLSPGAPTTTTTTANNKALENLFQHQKSHASSLTSASTTNRPRLSQQFTRAGKQQDPRSPLVVLIPTSANPTEVLAQRFAAWRAVIRSILVYLTETVSIQDEIVRQQLRLAHAVNFPFFVTENQHQPTSAEEKAIQKFFLPLGNGSVQDLPSILTLFHSQMAGSASRTSKELANEVIPRLEDLRRDLVVKIKEIKTLQSDFKNSCAKELQQTKQDLKIFQEAIEGARYGSAKNDPYLAKIALDKQIRKQITEENFLHEAFNNLQGSGKELEKVVVMEIQNALTIYARLLGQNAQLVFDVLISKLDTGFFNKEPIFEWDNFIAKDPNFIEPDLPMRHVRDIVYKNQTDPLAYEVRAGFLERRSKFLKSYSKGFYVLTPSFLHEFKTADRKKDFVPVMSLSLNDCTVAEHSKKGSSEHKFILHAKQNGIIHRGHNWVFRADSYDSMMNWFSDIKKLTSTSNPNEKAKFVTLRLNLDADGRPKKRDVPINVNGAPVPQQLTSTPRQTGQSNFTTPNLDNQTNTNTSVSIPETEYDNNMLRINSPNSPRTSRDGVQHTYDGNIYIETASGNMHYPRNSISGGKRN
ncbi:LAFE_0E11408g1_1 [Lachancea fermentati]|uniref:LAFE_0E11408g1_1 n=1 Tax=Lachancea fermentati TaxID=4955 RepID=A0A1G4MDW0_LACFM|nr:LAFE_0E11408g1_1 [Lachancea fermentati]